MTPRTPSATIIRSCEKGDLPRLMERVMRRPSVALGISRGIDSIEFRQSQPRGDEMVTPTGIEPVLQPWSRNSLCFQRCLPE